VGRLPVVALVGRPNVGKSTLFNRLAQRRISIVEDTPGVTRDRLYAEVRRDDYLYTLIDTGGFEPKTDSPLLMAMRRQTQLGIDEADVVIFLVDGKAGMLPADMEVATWLRQSNKIVVLAANKTEAQKNQDNAVEFYEMGLGEVFTISSAHGQGVGVMMDHVFSSLPDELQENARQALIESEGPSGQGWGHEEALDEAQAQMEAEEDEESDTPAEHSPKPAQVMLPDVVRLAVVGKPNAGKSSLINKLLGEDRHLVSEVAGTTMDAVDSFFDYGGTNYRIIDTAGIRRKRSIYQQMEKYAVVSALKALDRCDIALMMIDATEGVTEQDLKVAAFAHDKGRAVLILVNKWDLRKENELNAKEFEQTIRDKMSFLSYAPIRFISAKTGSRVFDILDTVNRVATQAFTRVPTGQLNKALAHAFAAHQPPVYKGRRVKIYYGAQVRVSPPTFVLATNVPEGVHFSYRRYLNNKVREAFGFEGTPIRLFFRQRGSEAGLQKNIEARKRTKALSRNNKGKGKKRSR